MKAKYVFNVKKMKATILVILLVFGLGSCMEYPERKQNAGVTPALADPNTPNPEGLPELSSASSSKIQRILNDATTKSCLDGFDVDRWKTQYPRATTCDLAPPIVGVSVAIKMKENGVYKHWYGSSGYANLEKQIKLDPDRVVRIGSGTKTFTSMLVLMEHLSATNPTFRAIPERDKFGQVITPASNAWDWLPTPYQEYLETLKHGSLSKPKLKKVTIDRLLEHTTCLPSYTDLLLPITTEQYPESYYIPFAPETVLFASNSLHSECDPTKTFVTEVTATDGTVNPATTIFEKNYHYSNTNYYLLGLIVEKLYSTSFKNALQTKLLTPLKMDNTYFPEGIEMPGYQANMYFDDYNNPDGIWENITEQDASLAFSAGQIVSNVKDLLTWIQAMTTGVNPLTKAPMLSNEVIDLRNPANHPELFYQFRPTRTDLDYGLGIILRDRFLLGHSGQINGGVLSINYHSGQDAWLVVIQNSAKFGIAGERYVETIAYQIFNEMFPGNGIPTKPQQ
ncbi:serine hydrolase domain-containing protein [Deltaproteobacteria bacterium TL4]